LVPLPDDAPPRAAQGEVVDLIKDELETIRTNRDRIAQERDAARVELEAWRRQAEDGRVTIAELGTQLAGKVELVEELRRQRDRLEVELGELRAPLLTRLLALWRR
jgi:predicted  nucleic acid-binding Zn-ribbon protein